MGRHKSYKPYTGNHAGRAIGKGYNGPPADGCKFIEADDWRERMSRGEQVYCGAPVSAPGSSWCDCHRAVVFTPVQPAPLKMKEYWPAGARVS